MDQRKRAFDSVDRLDELSQQVLLARLANKFMQSGDRSEIELSEEGSEPFAYVLSSERYDELEKAEVELGIRLSSDENLERRLVNNK